MNPPATTTPPLWLWLNLLSLDAPLVAVVWQDFAARCFPSPLNLPGRFTLALSVWAIYLADRLIDVSHPAELPETPRHKFYRQNRRAATLLLTFAVVADMVIAGRWLRPAIASNGLWVAVAVIIYLAGFALLRIGGRAAKKPTAALLFTAGIFLVAWTSEAHLWRELAGPASVFFALCMGNLVLIEIWERPIRKPGIRPRPTGWISMLVLASICAALAGHSQWYAAVAASALGLAALDLAGGSISPSVRRVLADAVLLTPLL